MVKWDEKLHPRDLFGRFTLAGAVSAGILDGNTEDVAAARPPRGGAPIDSGSGDGQGGAGGSGPNPPSGDVPEEPEEPNEIGEIQGIPLYDDFPPESTYVKFIMHQDKDVFWDGDAISNSQMALTGSPNLHHGDVYEYLNRREDFPPAGFQADGLWNTQEYGESLYPEFNYANENGDVEIPDDLRKKVRDRFGGETRGLELMDGLAIWKGDNLVYTRPPNNKKETKFWASLNESAFWTSDSGMHHGGVIEDFGEENEWEEDEALVSGIWHPSRRIVSAEAQHEDHIGDDKPDPEMFAWLEDYFPEARELEWVSVDDNALMTHYYYDMATKELKHKVPPAEEDLRPAFDKGYPQEVAEVGIDVVVMGDDNRPETRTRTAKLMDQPPEPGNFHKAVWLPDDFQDRGFERAGDVFWTAQGDESSIHHANVQEKHYGMLDSLSSREESYTDELPEDGYNVVMQNMGSKDRLEVSSMNPPQDDGPPPQEVWDRIDKYYSDWPREFKLDWAGDTRFYWDPKEKTPIRHERGTSGSANELNKTITNPASGRYAPLYDAPPNLGEVHKGIFTPDEGRNVTDVFWGRDQEGGNGVHHAHVITQHYDIPADTEDEDMPADSYKVWMQRDFTGQYDLEITPFNALADLPPSPPEDVWDKIDHYYGAWPRNFRVKWWGALRPFNPNTRERIL